MRIYLRMHFFDETFKFLGASGYSQSFCCCISHLTYTELIHQSKHFLKCTTLYLLGSKHGFIKVTLSSVFLKGQHAINDEGVLKLHPDNSLKLTPVHVQTNT